MTQTEEYYAEVDKRIRVDFPHKFGNTEQKQSTTPVQTVASANRSVKPGRKPVRLTSSQVAIAKKLGVPLEEYAKQLKTGVVDCFCSVLPNLCGKSILILLSTTKSVGSTFISRCTPCT